MTNRMLTTFKRSENFSTKADFGEKVGNVGLGLLRIGFGKTLKVEIISNNKIAFSKTPYSTSQKVIAVVAFVLFLPVTALLAGIGCIGTACSNSHSQILDAFNQNMEDHKPNQENNPTHQSTHTPTIVKHPDTPEEKAAVTIQKAFRGHKARKPLLSHNLFPQYQGQCAKAESPESASMPVAVGGRTRVYLPKDMPEVVLKCSGRKDCD